MASATAGRVVVRRARVGEHAAVGALTEAAYEPFLLGPDDDYRAKLRDAARRDREAELWVAVDDSHGEGDGREVLGTLTWCPVGSPWREAASASEGEFRMLAVAPAVQGRGVGATLVAAALERARAEGLRGVVLSSLRQMTTAHRTYERAGFLRRPDRDFSPMTDVHLIVYARELP